MHPNKLLIPALCASYSHCSAVNTTNANLTVALLHTAPPNWPLPILNRGWSGVKLNISETVDAGIDYIHQAAEQGADVISFPELWFLGFPTGNDQNNWTVEYLPMYINNSLVVGDGNFNRLIEGLRSAGIYAALAFAELSGDRIFMSQMLVSPGGDILIHRHKLRPSGSERWIFSDGTVDELRVVTTGGKLGRVGLLQCGEHLYPSMTFPMQVQKESIHFAPFPYLADADNTDALWWESSLSNAATVRTYATQSGAYSFLNSVGYAAVFDPYGYTIAEIDAKVNLDEHPILWATIDTSAFNTSQTYNSDGQESWATAQQIIDAIPGYVPHVEGKLVPHHENSVAWLLSGALTSELGATIDLGG